MGGDIYWGLAVMLGVCVAVFVAGQQICNRFSRRTAVTILAIDLVALVIFLKFLWDSPWLIKIVPLRNVIVLANFQVPLSALLAGLGWGLIKGTWLRRMIFIVPLLAISLWRGYGRLFDSPPPTRVRWKGDVCRQTSNATCSAAAGVTLLRAYGIDTSEEEMARMSLTRADGTTVHGRYRGLVMKTDGTPWRVEPIVSASVDELRRLASPRSPIILSVGLPPGAHAGTSGDGSGAVDRRYIDTYGWLPGMRHTVVLFGFTADGAKVDIGDPSVGRELWDVADLNVLWQGNGFRLVAR